MNKKIYIGADHAGFKLKERIKKYFEQEKISYEDVGNFVYDKKDDYPDFARKLGQKVVKNKTLGIMICGSSLGSCIATNKVKGVRAVSVCDEGQAKLARNDNNANVLCLAGNDFKDDKKKLSRICFQKQKRMINVFLTEKFSKAKRHQRRVKKISKIK